MKYRENPRTWILLLLHACIFFLLVVQTSAQCDPSDIQPAIGYNVIDCQVQFGAVNAGDVALDELCYYWDFGDGTGSQEQSPTKNYTETDTYNVTLTVFCCDSPPGTGEVTVGVEVDVVCSECELPDDLALIQEDTWPCIYEFNPSIALDNPLWCWEWTSSDGQTSENTGNFIVQYNCSGTYDVCLTIWCCDNPLDFVQECVTIDADCPCVFGPDDADFIVTVDEANCAVTVNLVEPSIWCPDQYCWHWDFGDGASSANNVNSASHTYSGSGTYTITLDITCCDNPLMGYWVDKVIDIDCGDCEVDPLFSIAETSGCCYLFQDVTPNPATEFCSSWQVLDFMGIPIASGIGQTFMICASTLGITSGTVTICYTDCCVADDGTITQVTFCQELEIDCACIVPSGIAFTSSTNDDCELTLQVTGPFDPDLHCVEWTIDGETFTAGSQASYTHQLPPCTNDVIDVCMRVYCCDSPEIYTDYCAIIFIDCPCQLPDGGILFTDVDDCFVYASAFLGEGCYDAYCFEWDFGDGSAIVMNNSPVLGHSYSANGSYEICVKIYCCGEPDNYIEVCGYVFISDCYEPVLEQPCEINASWNYETIDFNSLCVQFTDFTTTNSFTNINSWNWYFDDGTFSTSPNPMHCFPECGTYDVQLEVIGQSPDGYCVSTFSWFVAFPCLSFTTCPTDINNDNVTNTLDLLELLGSFGQDCE